MSRTIQTQLIKKGLVKGTSINRSMTNPFSDKSRQNRFGKLVKWRVWLKADEIPESWPKICCLCGRKVSNRNIDTLENESDLLHDIQLEYSKKEKEFMIGAAKICPTCKGLRKNDSQR